MRQLTRPQTTSFRHAPTVLRLVLFAGGHVLLGASSASAQTCVDNQLTALPSPPLVPNAGHGSSVALFGDLAVVGAPLADVGAGAAGIVTVYERNGTAAGGGRGEERATWVLHAILTASDAAPGDGFGTSVALLGPDRIAVGAPLHDGFGLDSGAVYVFDRTDGIWTRTAKLGAGTPPGSLLGTALAAQKGTIVATAPVIDPCAGPACGDIAAYVFDEAAGEWTLQAKLTPPDGGAGSDFGACVALASDLILIGAPSDGELANLAGAAYLYVRVDAGGGHVEWSEGTKLLPSFTPVITARYGSAVAILGDELLIGAPGADLGGTNSGAIESRVVVEGDPDSSRVSQVMIGAQANAVGIALAFGDPDHFVAGRGVSTTTPRVALYQRLEGAWVRTTLLGVAVPRPGAASGLGRCVAAEGETVLAGAPLAATARGGPGSGRVFEGSTVASVDCDGDGIHDECAVLLELVGDFNENNVPDACDDCNGNDVPDQQDIASGTSFDCDGNFDPDECQIALDSTLDCNRNGLIDSCEILAGLSDDCDLDGVPDECTIAAGLVTDCDGNNSPDFCDAVTFIDQMIADGGWYLSQSWGPHDLLWLNPMTVEPGGETVVGISIIWITPLGGLPSPAPGTPAMLLLYTDPTADGLPDDAILAGAFATTIEDGDEPGVFRTIPIPPTFVGDVGDRFFVAAVIPSLPILTVAAVADFSPSPDEIGWLMGTTAGTFDPHDLSMIEPVDTPCVFLLRTISASGLVLAADLDCDGSVGPGDLGLLLGAWGPCPTDPDDAPMAPLGFCAGDFNSDGVVDGIDLGLMLGVWG